MASVTTKREYLLNELWILSWGASVQRANLFRQTASDEKKSKFRRAVIGYANKKLIPSYFSQVTEMTHISNISRLSAYGTKVGENVLQKNGYKFGVAQKLINLQLKYLWCLDVVVEPPHCPVDRIIINKTRLREKVSWTKMVDLNEYKEVIAAIREVADRSGQTVARWELEVYDRAAT